jgi:hypothetical protein
MMTNYVYPVIGPAAVAEITPQLVLQVLEPH